MNAHWFLLCLGLAGSAMAADTAAPVPMPLAPSPGFKATAGSDKPVALRRVLSPKISVMTVTRNADGSLSSNCVEKPNPRVRELLKQRTVNPQPQGSQP